MSETEAQTLRDLTSSVLFAPGFPKRSFLTNEQLEVHPQSTQNELNAPALEAIAKAKEARALLELMVRRLGQARYEPAIPTLAVLWRECAFEPVRVKAGWALYAMRTGEARNALAALIDDSNDFSSFMAIRAIFDEDPFRAFDKLEARFADGHLGSPLVGCRILSIFQPAAYTNEQDTLVSIWPERRAPDWLKQDRRWLDLCARLRHHPNFGNAAREVLKHADPIDVQAALARARHDNPARPIGPQTTLRGDLLSRYRKGQFESVWTEIRSYRQIGGPLREEILAVAIETMGRVVHNADLIVERLRARGWKALSAQHHDLRTRPSTGDGAIFAKIEEITESPIPVSLLAFWRIVGGINWVWDHETGATSPNLGVDIDLAEMDPLCIDPPCVVALEFDSWLDQKNVIDPDLVEPFQVILAPDYLHKAAIGGGPPYAVYLPFHGADPVFAEERHQLPFVDYLRLAFQWAGFPGLADCSERRGVDRFVKEFGKGLLPF